MECFDDRLKQLREIIKAYEDYYKTIHKVCPHLYDIAAGLNHKDPFIVHKAYIAGYIFIKEEINKAN